MFLPPAWFLLSSCQALACFIPGFLHENNYHLLAKKVETVV
jgi:hypothetical protein